MTETARTLECGCVIYFDLVPCAEHSASLESGDESLHVELSFEDKYSRAPLCRHGVGLERVQRSHLGIDDEPMLLSEATLADMLQDVADELRHGHAAFVIAAVANALRGADTHHKLTLHQTKRGKWLSPSDHTARKRQHLAWIIRLGRLQRDGWQTDAAVHRIAETTGNSVSRVYAGIAEENEWQAEATKIAKAIRELKGLERGRRSPSPE